MIPFIFWMGVREAVFATIRLGRGSLCFFCLRLTNVTGDIKVFRHPSLPSGAILCFLFFLFLSFVRFRLVVQANKHGQPANQASGYC